MQTNNFIYHIQILFLMLNEKQFKQIKDELDNCQKPLFLFDDDPDGLASFLLLYRYKKEGKGIIVKSAPKISIKFLDKVKEYCPDKIFVLDVPVMDQEFVDSVNIPVVWIDHHNPWPIENVKYFNPRINGDSVPTSMICYNVVKQDLWIAMIGIVGDWHLGHADEFRKKYLKLLPKNINKPEDALFKTQLGHLIRICAFNLKGKTQDVLKSVKILTRIKDPSEILEQKTSQGRFIYKRFEKMNRDYEPLLKKSMSVGKKKGKLLLFNYKEKTSFTKELSNELLFNFPKKIIIVCREKSGEMKCSLRSTKVLLPEIVENALKGVNGYGGGHEHACGSCVKVEDFRQFVNNIKEQIK